MACKGIWPDATLTASLLKIAVKIGRQELVQRLSDHAGSMKSSATGSCNSTRDELQRQATMIKAHARERDLGSATRIFEKLRASGLTLTPMLYNCYLDACVQCGDLDGAKAHFEEMKGLNFVDVVGYNTVLKAYLSRGCTQDAHNLVKEMSSRGLQANKVTYNELLHAKVLAKDRRGIWNLVDEMRGAGVRANSVTCSILLKSLAAHSHPSDVEKVIALIDEVEEPIDEVLFSSMIEACIRIKQLDVLSDLMRRYRQKGGFVNLTAPTYGSMIKAYGQSGDVARVRELWREMEERGVKPTSITLGCMTEALVANQQADEAWELLHNQSEIDDRKGCVNTVIYSTVLKGFAFARRIDKVFCVYKEMRGNNIPCNTITYNTMLDACAKCCTMDRASGLLEDMRESAVEPDIITYSTIVKGYCLEGDVDRAFSVLEDMKSDDKFAPDEIMYNSILDGCAKQHRVDDALRLLDEMKLTGVIPSNYTLSILVKLLGHARRLSQAFKLVEELSQKHGFRPNVQVYTCLVQACLLNRRLERALTLHDTMVADEGCRTDEKFYAVLARGCLQLHQPLKAVEVVRAAYLLPGHNLALPARKDARPVGVESRALDEVASRLRSGGKEEYDAFTSLSTDLYEYRGIHLGDGQGTSSRRGGGDGGQRRGRRGGGGGGGYRSGK
jgi:pentatricopeptide repeat protein